MQVLITYNESVKEYEFNKLLQQFFYDIIFTVDTLMTKVSTYSVLVDRLTDSDIGLRLTEK